MLSDMGPALISFSKLHSMILYFCHRHIIENFGANCGIGLWAQKLLRCKTLKEFLFIRKQIEAEINAFLSKKIKSPEIGLDDDSKINDLKIIEITDELKMKSFPLSTFSWNPKLIIMIHSLLEIGMIYENQFLSVEEKKQIQKKK